MTIPFILAVCLAVAGTSAAMALRNAVHSILALTVGLIGIAALYLELGAQFVGFTQVLVYVGAVAILAVFAIMTTRSDGEGAPAWRSVSAGAIVGVAIAAGLFALLARTFARVELASAKDVAPDAPVAQIGAALLHGFALPLEVMGLLLTAALVGAVVVAMPGKRGGA